ncbi:hypothetical protein Dimus_038135 [Dionaea muscipula]
MTYRFIDDALVSGWVERRFSETNTFHLWFGEMTITLDDVHQLLGLLVTGRPVHYDGGIDRLTIMELMTELLGASAADMAMGMDHQLVKLRWLHEHFEPLILDSCSEVEVEHAVLAYLLYILGTTIFTSKGGDKVSLSYLHVLRDLTSLDAYAWGAACQDFLYRELGKASKVGTRQIAEYLTLLEVWVYEHFIILPATYD